MIRIIHISDVHYGKYKSHDKLIKRNLIKIWKKYFNTEEKKMETFLLIAGDLTHDGTPKQYKELKAELEKFKYKLLLAPGNHDYGSEGLSYNKKRAQDFDRLMVKKLTDLKGTYFPKTKPVTKVLTGGNGKLKVLSIGLNGCLKTLDFIGILPHDTACGELGITQIKNLKKILKNQEYKNMRKIVYLHHHPFVQYHPTHRLYDSEKLMLILYDRVKVLAFGHMHKREKCREEQSFFDIQHIADAG